MGQSSTPPIALREIDALFESPLALANIICNNGSNMPALDQYHETVRTALIKDGWTITHDPLTLVVGADRVHIDLAAERVIAAEKGVSKIAVEIKTFAGASRIAD